MLTTITCANLPVSPTPCVSVTSSEASPSVGVKRATTYTTDGAQVGVGDAQSESLHVLCNTMHNNNTTSAAHQKVRSYIVRYPVRRTAQSTLHFSPWHTCSFQGHLNFSGKHSATLQLREDYSFTFPPLSVL